MLTLTATEIRLMMGNVPYIKYNVPTTATNAMTPEMIPNVLYPSIVNVVVTNIM